MWTVGQQATQAGEQQGEGGAQGAEQGGNASAGVAGAFQHTGKLPPVATGSAAGGPSASERAFDGAPLGTGDGPPPGAGGAADAPEVAAARDLLQRARPIWTEPVEDPRQLLSAAQRVIEGARGASDPAVAQALLGLVRTYAGEYAQVKDAISQAEAELAHRAPAQHAAPAAPVAAGFDWTTLLVAGKHGTGAPGQVSGEQRAQLQAIAAGRPARLDAELARLGTRLNDSRWKPYAGNHGWMYEGDQGAATVTRQSDRILDLAVQELFAGKSVEAYVNGVVTYDGTVSVGSGWANGMAAEYVRRWLATDPAARAALLAAGFAVTADNQFAAIDNSGHIVVGAPAMAYLRDHQNGKLLDVLSGLMGQPGSAQKAMDAQIEMVKVHIVEPLERNGVAKAMAGWPAGSVQAAIHLGNWDPAGGPIVNPNDFKATGGDPLKLVRAFAKNMAPWIKKPNGALILGGSMNTSFPLQGHMERWGGGGLASAVYGTRKLHMTLQEAGSDPALAGHVLVVGPGAAPNAPGKVDLYDTGP